MKLHEYESAIAVLADRYDMVVMESDNDYQGDTYGLIKDGGRWGYVVDGFGSCEGCDPWMGTRGYLWENEPTEDVSAELNLMVERLDNSIRWFDSLDELWQYLNSDDIGLEWYGWADGFGNFKEKVKEIM